MNKSGNLDHPEESEELISDSTFFFLLMLTFVIGFILTIYGLFFSVLALVIGLVVLFGLFPVMFYLAMKKGVFTFDIEKLLRK